MNRVAIICEYNPLHTGHEYLLNIARTHFNADEVYCIMSGSFVQRGEPAVCDRFTRALWAIKKGADLVAEMPVLSGSLAADDFATMGVLSAARLGATHLLFGSECGEISPFISASDEMNCDDFRNKLAENMAKGMTYPAAVSASLSGKLDLSQPNNLLGLCYVNAIKKTGCGLLPITTKRIGSYHSDEVCNQYMSASAIRNALASNKSVLGHIDNDFLGKMLPFDKTKLNSFGEYCLARAVSATKDDWRDLHEVDEGLENRLFQCAKQAKTADEFLSTVKTKRYTLSKLRRIFAYLALDITKQHVKEILSAPYLRILAVVKNDELLGYISGKPGVFMRYGAVPQELKKYWDKENAAARLRDVFSVTGCCQCGKDNAIIVENCD